MDEIIILLQFIKETPGAAYFIFFVGVAWLLGRNRKWLRGSRKLIAAWSLFRLRQAAKKHAPPSLFHTLRGVDPFVFEEMILTALKKRGLRIKRNTRYTGDGGIDGRFWISGRPVLIQAKRYSGAISSQHVKSFKSLCERQRTQGIFVHTGTTPSTLRQARKASESVQIISGRAMIDLLTGRPVRILGQRI